jgi:predicted RNase H-like nuclease
MLVVGVDGCPGGWLAIVYDIEAALLTPHVYASFTDLITAYPDATSIAVDIPIGLSEGAPRECDIAARRVLGARRSSVFPAPDPRVLDEATYTDALARSRSLMDKGISKQGFAIYAKVAEVNRAMTPELQQRVIEVHPEVSFWALADGRPLEHSKRNAHGFEERSLLLAEAFRGMALPSRQKARWRARPASADDVLDAIVASWSARRYATGMSSRLPAEPPRDSRGLRMEIVY